MDNWTRYTTALRKVEEKITATGYFGRPGFDGGKTHATFQRKPICGTVLPEESRFQWCAHGLHINYLECGNCKRIIEKRLREALGE